MTCYSSWTMISSLAKALSQRPADELRKMLETARTTAQRAQFEVEVIEEALSSAPKEPKSAGAAVPSKGTSAQEARELVLRVVGELSRATPKEIREVIEDDSINVYNAVAQLVKEGKLTRDAGVYAIPTSSANGSPPGGLKAGTQLSSHPPL